MARKRGGLAGIWDRNKKIIKPLVEVGATLLAGGNPMAGAAAGAAMEGFDRPGKGGIGFDVKQGAIGGLKGYGAGQLGNVAKAGLGNLFAAQAAPAAASTVAPSGAGQLAAPTLTRPLSAAYGAGPQNPFAVGATSPSVPAAGGNVLANLGNIFKGMSPADYARIIGSAGASGLEYVSSKERSKLSERELAERIRQYNLEEARRAREEALKMQDRERMLAIAAEREKELAPVRDMLMRAILGGQNTLFGGSVMQGATSPGARYL